MSVLQHLLRLVRRPLALGRYTPPSYGSTCSDRAARFCDECGVLHTRDADLCTRCAGRACRCGRPKLPEHETCGRGPCKAARTRERNRRENVVPIKGARTA